MTDLENKRQIARLSLRELSQRSGIQKEKLWRYLRPVELTPAAARKVETIIEAEFRALEQTIDRVAAERGVFFHPVAD